MSQSKKKRTDKRSVEQEPSSKVVVRDRKGRRTGFIIASVVIALILVIIGVSYYPTYVAPYRRTIITVDDITIRMDYFLKRTQLAGADPMTMLGDLAKEQMMKLGAPRYGIEVNPEDINQELRRIARGGSETISESEFKEWYRQRLNETELSDSEYKEIIDTNLLAARLYEHLAERMSTLAEQIHIHAILVDTEKEAEKVKARLDAGEDFAVLAREVSLDAKSSENGGDLGWVPRGVLAPVIEYEAWTMSSGNISEPVVYYDTNDPDAVAPIGSYILMVSEKADARGVAEEYLPVLRSRLLEDWFSEEWGLHEVQYYGFNNGFDSETYAWINYQLQKK
ncbi:peptidylprolyl isomerase [Chloroflexota bacterium]